MSSANKDEQLAEQATTINPAVRPLLKRIALESATALCVGLLLAFIWPKVVGEEFSTRGHARLYAPFSGFMYGQAAREQTSVVLIDNAGLRDAGEAWPPHYSYHARLLRALARYQPRAVFFDIYFSEIRDDPSLALLTKSLCAMREQGTRVFLGVSPDATGSSRLRPELEALQGKCFEKVALQYTPDSLDRLAWAYPLENEEEKNGHGEALPSAALAIYREAFGRKLHVDDNELALTRGLHPAAYGLRWVEDASKERGKAHGEVGGRVSYCRQDLGLLELAPAIVKNWLHHEAEKPICVYHETLYASDLAASSEQEEAILGRLLTGKVVMVGAALSGGGDRVLSPLHGRIPGVYLHAMALDNLLTLGRDYPRDIHMEVSAHQSHLKLYLFLFLSLFVGLVFPKAIQACWKASWPKSACACIRSVRDAAQAGLDPVRAWLFGVAGTIPQTKTDYCVRALRGALRLLADVIWVIGKLALAMVVVCLFIWVGQRWFSIGLMSTVDVVFFTFAAEWFELNEKLLKKLGMGKSED